MMISDLVSADVIHVISITETARGHDDDWKTFPVKRRRTSSETDLRPSISAAPEDSSLWHQKSRLAAAAIQTF